MTNDEILQAAKEVGAVIDVLMLGRHDNTVFTTGELERFAAIVEKRTIERCVVACKTQMDLREEARAAHKAEESLMSGDEVKALSALRHESNVRLYNAGINKCAAAIRKLGEQE